MQDNFGEDVGEVLRRAKAYATVANRGIPTGPDPIALARALLTDVPQTKVTLKRMAENIPPICAFLTPLLTPEPGPPPAEQTEVAQTTLQILRSAYQVATHCPINGDKRVHVLHLWYAVFHSDDEGLGMWMHNQGLNRDMICAAVDMALEVPLDVRPALPARAQALLNRFADDWTQLAIEGKLRPAIGRASEFEQLCEQLIRLQKRNVVLTGEGGVGKTFLVRHLAWALVHAPQTVPWQLRQCQVYALDLLRMRMGGGTIGELEERTHALINVVEKHGDRIILFVDEMHTMIGSPIGGAAMDLANALKPVLAEGSARCIGATTPLEYRKHISTDPALARRFAELLIPPLSASDTLALLGEERKRFEAHSGCVIEDAALESIVELSTRYMPNRQFPDKAVDLLDSACAHASYTRQTWVTSATVKQVIARNLGLAEVDEPDMTIKRIEELLNEKVVGQTQACAAIARHLVGAFRLPATHVGPRTVMLFTGPSRVGKTLAATAIGEILCARPEQFLRINMNEIMGDTADAEVVQHYLIGVPPGYVGWERGGVLTNHVSRYPRSVILLDEFEKPHPQVLNLFLGIFDRGIILNNVGETVSFQDCYFVLTSNVLAGGASTAQPNDLLLRREFTRSGFLPELINRLKAIVQFNSLNESALQEIARKKLVGLQRLYLESFSIQIRFQPDIARVAEVVVQHALREVGNGAGQPIGFPGARQGPPAQPEGNASGLDRAVADRIESQVNGVVDELGEYDWVEVRVVRDSDGGEAIRVQAVPYVAQAVLIAGEEKLADQLAATYPEARWTVAPVEAIPDMSSIPGETIPILVVPQEHERLLPELRTWESWTIVRLLQGEPEAPSDKPPRFCIEPGSRSVAFLRYIQERLDAARAARRRQLLSALLEQFETESGTEETELARVAPIRVEGGMNP